MPDAISAILQLMSAPSDKISVRTSYNLTALSFTAEQLADAINQHGDKSGSNSWLNISYDPDPVRQGIADTWPNSIDDSQARSDWGFNPEWCLSRMVQDMIYNLRRKLDLQ
jgi:nucleoside-diphosphate-sugar epimerase